jgi:SnoaL-like domain
MKLRGYLALAFISTALCCVASSAALAKGLTEEQKLVERSKIEELISRSTWAFDTQDVEAWLATFTADGEWLTQFASCKGQEALRAYFTKLSCLGVPGGGPAPGAPPRGPAPAGAAGAPGGPPPGNGGAAEPAAPGVGAASGGLGRGVRIITSPIYDFIDDHTVNYRAYYMTIYSKTNSQGPPSGSVGSVGHYDHTLVKVNGKWLIKQSQLKH